MPLWTLDIFVHDICLLSFQFSSVQFSCSVMSNSLRPHEQQHTRLPCPSLSPRVLKLMSIESVMPSNHLLVLSTDPTVGTICHSLLLPSIFPSIRVFSIELAFPIRWPKYWSFSFSISPSNKYSGLISFRIDLFDLLAVPGTIRSIVQHHYSKAPILQCSALFIVQLSYPYMTTGKNISLTIQTFVGKVMSLLFFLI